MRRGSKKHLRAFEVTLPRPVVDGVLVVVGQVEILDLELELALPLFQAGDSGKRREMLQVAKFFIHHWSSGDEKRTRPRPTWNVGMNMGRGWSQNCER